MNQDIADERIKAAVRQRYTDLARRFLGEEPFAKASQTGCCAPATATSCCGPAPQAVASKTQSGCCGPAEVAVESAGGAARFYPAAELADLSESVTGASAGCGDPIAIASLRPGEVVLDLGSGGGIDCFMAARQVGPEGRVIGLDMTPEMIKLARRNARQVGATNVEFRYGEMEEIPLPDESVDVIISNCVINLSPDKDAVFEEAFRVLRPGGRLSVSDIVVNGELPQPIRGSLNSWAGCIAGALDEADYLGKIRAAGFVEIEVQSRDYVNIGEAEWESTHDLLDAAGLSPRDLDCKVASVRVTARKPA